MAGLGVGGVAGRSWLVSQGDILRGYHKISQKCR